jgi:uncharacterized protein
MIEIQEMSRHEAEGLLARVKYGHLRCSRNDQPYVVPIHYSYRGPDIFFYTTEGKKSEILNVNPAICLQVEEVDDAGDWQSVIVIGDAERIIEPGEREEALKIVTADNPKLSPAVSIKWRDNWIRENVEAIYRIMPRMVTGRRAVHVETNAASVQGARRRPQIY